MVVCVNDNHTTARECGLKSGTCGASCCESGFDNSLYSARHRADLVARIPSPLARSGIVCVACFDMLWSYDASTRSLHSAMELHIKVSRDWWQHFHCGDRARDFLNVAEDEYVSPDRRVAQRHAGYCG